MNELSNFVNIFSSLIPAICGLFFIVLLIVAYLTQVRFNSIRNKLYRYLLINVFVMLVIEIATSFIFYYVKYNAVYLMFIRVTWGTGIVWFLFLYLYSFCFLKNINADNFWALIKENKPCKRFLIYTIIYLVLYCFIPFDMPTSLQDFSYIPGTGAVAVMVYCWIAVLIIIYTMIVSRKTADIRKKISTLIMLIEIIVVFLVQLYFDNIIILAMGAALQMYFLYFNIENPDLSMIRELQSVKDDIETSNKAKSDFLSNMSHEIRTPMNAIVGFSQTLLNNPTFDEVSARNDIKHITAAGNNLLDIINNILDISKIESGSESLDMKEYSLKNIIMELSSIIEPRIANKKLKLILNIDENIPSVLYGDPTKLFQVLLNILTNAVKYTEVGRITLTINGTKNGSNEDLHIRVSDTGFGIKKEDYGKIFEKFSRLDAAKTNEIEGTGLGLVITKRYVDLMGGKIWFDSEYGAGTNFYIDLSQKIINETAIGSLNESAVVESNDYIDFSGHKVFVVDDNKLNLKVAARILSKYNIEVETLESAKDLIYKIKAEEPCDMVFLDHMMPEMDGIEAVHILRKLEGYKLPPIVALTANAITGMKEMYLKEGFDEYLSKPTNVSELQKILVKYFKKDGA